MNKIIIEFDQTGKSHLKLEGENIPLDLIISLLQVHMKNFERELLTQTIIKRMTEPLIKPAINMPSLPSLKELKKQ
jgi:hypothetical protein